MRALRNPVSIVVLTLLLDRPRHPYEMKGLLRERHIGEVVKLRGGSLYDAIERLRKAELVEPVETSRSGARPERTVFRITPAGEEMLRSLLTEYLGTPAQEFPIFVTALAHILVLEPAEAAALLRRRADVVERECAELDAGLAASELPRVVLLEADYTRAIRHAELAWLTSTAAGIESGEIGWIGRSDWD